MPFSDIQLELFDIDQVMPRLLRVNYDAFNNIDCIIRHVVTSSGDYYFKVSSEDPQDVWPTGAPTYTCYLATEPLLSYQAASMITTSTTIREGLGGLDNLQRFDITAPVATHLEITATALLPTIEPYLRVYEYGGLGLITEGTLSVMADLPASPNPYHLTVQNGNDGIDPGSGDSFELDVILSPL